VLEGETMSQSFQSVLPGLIDLAVEVITTHAERLSELDRAIGDGDHGVNMLRGFGAIAQRRRELDQMELGAALESIGTILVTNVGGASGPLYGSLFMAMGRAARRADGDRSLTSMLEEGVAAVKRRGKSDAGEKTMLDVLVPIQLAWIEACEKDLSSRAAAEHVRRAAENGLESTRSMTATKGRAAFLRERSVGHLDPGAYSTFLLVNATCRAILEQKP
jgi:dihydroxyacetone kinase-like protein